MAIKYLTWWRRHTPIKIWHLSMPVFSVGNQHLYKKFEYERELVDSDEIIYKKVCI